MAFQKLVHIQKGEEGAIYLIVQLRMCQYGCCANNFTLYEPCTLRALCYLKILLEALHFLR